MAAELDAMMIGMSDKAVHDWSLNSLRTIARSASEQVRQSTGDLAYCERAKTSTTRPPDSLGGNSSVKGQPNLTIPMFWPYETPGPGFHIKILGSHPNFQNEKFKN